MLLIEKVCILRKISKIEFFLKITSCTLLIFLLSIIIIPTFAQNQDAVQELNQKALELLTEENYLESLTISDQVLSMDPSNFDALYHKARALQGLYRYTESITYFEQIIDNYDVVTNKVLYNYGVSLSRIEHYEDAITYFEYLEEDSALKLAALNQKAYALIKLERYEEALDVLKHILELDDKNLQALTNKANALSKLGLHDDALSTIEFALRNYPDNVLALTNKGIIEHNQGKSIHAIVTFLDAIKKEPENPLPLVEMARVTSELGRHHEALDFYNRVLEIKPFDVVALNNKGKTLFDLNRDDEALESFKKVLEINPQDSIALNNVGGYYFRQGSYEDAIVYYDKAIAADKNVDALNNKFLSLMQLERFDSAFTVAEQILTEEPDSENAAQNIILLQEKNIAEIKELTKFAAVILIFSVMILFSVELYRLIRNHPEKLTEKRNTLSFLILLWALIAMIVLLIALLFGKPIFDEKNFFAGWVYVIITLGVSASFGAFFYLHSTVGLRKELDPLYASLYSIKDKWEDPDHRISR